MAECFFLSINFYLVVRQYEKLQLNLNLYFHFCLPGVADGVGGWRDYGVDPSQFSATLMRTCERLVKEGRFTPSNPVGILTSGYYELLQNKVPLLGEYMRTQTPHRDNALQYTQSLVE